MISSHQPSADSQRPAANSRQPFKTCAFLKPLALVYEAVTFARNSRYDKGAASSFRADFPVISIGNITAGGTGKTPHTEYLTRLLSGRYRIAVLSRGYGRRTKGYIEVSVGANALQVGDEPLQMSRKFPDVTFAVCENRAEGLQRLTHSTHPDAVILDDAFQHRAVTPSLNILLINWNRNIMDDMVLPAGLLRESASGRRRADIIIISKCPDNLSPGQMDIERKRLQCSDSQKVFFSTMEYDGLVPFDASSPARSLNSITDRSSVIVATGIASPGPIIRELSKRTADITPLTFSDHHSFNDRDIARIGRAVNEARLSDKIVITTEKDAARLQDMHISPELRRLIYILPVRVRLIDGQSDFDNIIINHIENFKKDR